MRRSGLWFALVAVVLGTTLAVAWAGDEPLPPRSLEMWVTGNGGAQISFDGSQWDVVREADVTDGLKLVFPTWVRGPVRIRVIGGTFVDVAQGGTVRVSWLPMVRGWQFESVAGTVEATTSNRTTRIAPGRSITITTLGALDITPGRNPARDRGLDGLPEVSGFEPFEDDI